MHPAVRRTLLVIALMSLLAPAARAQTIRSGQVVGAITDENQGLLPGVTITLRSPALQVPEIVRTSDAEGRYEFVDLPPGTYSLTYELAGFTTLVRQDVRLTTGFIARIDARLAVAARAETITVSGQSPVVDVASTRGGGTVTQEVLAAVPSNRNYQDVMLLVPGAQVTGPPQVGEIGFRALTGGFKTYGLAGQTTTSIEGIEMQPNEAPDFTSTEEVDVKTFGNTAETAVPGAAVQLIAKSGGNDFHGEVTQYAINKKFNSTNVDDELRAQGISEGDAMNYNYDFAGDLGGRVIRDRLWFYSAFRYVRNERTAPGYADAPGPDGRYGTLDDVAGQLPGKNTNQTLKLSGQPTANHKLIGFFARNNIEEDHALADRFTPRESTLILQQIAYQYKAEWQGTLTPQLLATSMYARNYYDAGYTLPPESENVPNHLDRETGFQTGASFDSRSTITRRPWRHQASGMISWFPARRLAGTHQLTSGYRLWWAGQDLEAPSQQTGNYRLLFDRVGGVSYTPAEFHPKNFPVNGTARENVYSAYVSDAWQPGRRLTINAGVRFERISTWVPAQTKEQGSFGTAGAFPRVDTGSWTSVAPRAGVAFDLVGDGRTVAKATFGRYNFDPGAGYAQEWNQNTVTTYMFRWNDRNGDKAYQPGEVNLDVNGPDFINVTGATNTIVNGDLQQPYANQLSASVERELGAELSVRMLYVLNSVRDQNQAINVLRPYSVYSLPRTRRDPGPNGVLGDSDDAGTVTVYDYDPAYAGSRFVGNQRITSDRTDTFQNLEFTITKRRSHKWFGFTSFLATKNHRWLTLVPDSPNDEYFPLDDTWEISYRLAAGYELPYAIQVSTLYEIFDGLPGQRTNLFRTADPDGGPALRQTYNLRVEPYGERQGPIRQIVNLRGAKDFRWGSNKVSVMVDLLNLFNTNVAWGAATGGGTAGQSSAGINYASGPTFGYVTRIVSPRYVRFGATFKF